VKAKSPLSSVFGLHSPSVNRFKFAPGLAAAVLLLTGWISAAYANTTTWSGASGSDINWSDAANWNPNAPTLTGSDIVFANAGAAAVGTTTSIVDSSQTIDSLIFNNVGGSAAAQTLQLNNGVVLADTGAISTAFNSGVATGGV
jgi:hypothetical protein